MQDKHSASSCYQISQVKVFPNLNVIEVRGEPHRVEPKVMMLLDYLSQHQGKVCSKQDLIEAIWPNQIIADEALTRLVFVLRNVLKDDAKAPKFIATVPKKGYVLLAPVSTLQKKQFNKSLLSKVILSFVFFVGIWYAQYQPMPEYKIIKSTPITFQEGREYDYVENENISAYFHQYQGVTKLMVAEDDHSYRELTNDEWQKRSLKVIKNSFFYVRFNDSESQIIRQTLTSGPEIIFSSPKPIYHLSLNNQQQLLLFSLYKDNANAELHQFSFVDRQVSPFSFSTKFVPKVIKQHFYDESTETLVLVGVRSRLPVIYGYRFGDSNYQFEFSGFDNINSISAGKYDNTLLVAGSYQQIRGIWSVNTVSNDVVLLLNANDDVIAGVHMSEDKQHIYYTSENYRQDIVAVDWQGREVALPELNSTLIEGQAQYSPDNTLIYFASDRSGDTELYQYELYTQGIEQVTNIQANSIWYYRFSHNRDKLAIVFSTDYIQLAIVDVKTGNIVQSIELEEIKFPLAWSKDDQFIYVSEHRSQIAMYLYDATTLDVKNMQLHLGLSAVEVQNMEIIAFDYTSDQFVYYNFNDKTGRPISASFPKPAQLAPSRVYVDSKQAYVVETNNDKQQLLQVHFSEMNKNWRITKQSEFRYKAKVQAINPQQQNLLFIKNDSSENGSIMELTLQP